MKEIEANDAAPGKPQDVANLYSRVELDGVYHTFSATREQARARLRERTQSQPLVEPGPTMATETVMEVVEATVAVPLKAVVETPAEVPLPAPIEARVPVPVPAALPAPVEARLVAVPPPTLEAVAEAVIDEMPRASARPGPSLYVMSEPGAPPPASGSVEAQRAGDRRSVDRHKLADADVSRWFALKDAKQRKGVERGGEDGRPPVLAVFSLAGGVGKTSLMASLGSMLASRGERVLLMDTSRYGLVSLYFGARDLRAEGVRSFSRGEAGGAPVRVMNVDPDSVGEERSRRDLVAEAMAQSTEMLQRVLIDVPTGSESLLVRMRETAPTVLVPVEPNLTSVVSLQRIQGFFRGHPEGAVRSLRPYFLLNKFDTSEALHCEVREMLREQLGERLLPFAMRRSRAVNEALVEGMTAVDYAAHAPIVEDFAQLASWTRSIAEPAMVALPMLRWSEA